jgi:hypothetical protein
LNISLAIAVVKKAKNLSYFSLNITFFHLILLFLEEFCSNK